MLKITVRTLWQTFSALVIVLFFAAYGYRGPSTKYKAPSVMDTLHRAWTTVVNTIHGQHLYAMYWGADWHDVFISLRLIVLAMLIAMSIGTVLATVQFRTTSGLLKQGIDILCGWLETIPEALYVIVTIVIVVFSIRHLHVHVPFLPASEPNLAQTWIPAISIAIPAGMYIWHMLTLQFNEELSADYVRTALAKGASKRHIFYRHVFPNILPALRRAFRASSLIVLSSAFFAEFYMEYTGVLFHFTDAVGMNMFGGMSGAKPRGVPLYQTGLTFEMLAFLVVCGGLMTLILFTTRDRIWAERVSHASKRGKLNGKWILTGAILLLVVLVLGSFPHILTTTSPSAKYVPNWSGNSIPSTPPFPPSSKHPLGTDGLGRDLLARTLYGTWPSLWPAVLTSTCIVVVGLVIGSINVFASNRVVSALLRLWSGPFAILPVLPIIFLALYDRNYHAPFSLQMGQYVAWLVVFESGRTIEAFTGALQEWNQFDFMEGVVSSGRRRISALWTHLRSWVTQFTIQYWFSELARVLSIMTILAAFHIYIVETWGTEQFTAGFPPLQGIISAQMSWFQMLGAATNSMAYVNYPYILYAPLLALLITTVGANLVVKGLRASRSE